MSSKRVGLICAKDLALIALTRHWSCGGAVAIRSTLGIVLDFTDPMSGSAPQMRLLVGACGSASVAALPLYLPTLHAELAQTMTVIMTHTAQTFLPAHTVGLMADRVVTGDARPTGRRTTRRALAAQHDIVLVMPATANMIAAAVTGAAPNLLAGVVLAATCPVVFAPVMSPSMWEKPVVARNIAQLRADGHHVIEPVSVSAMTRRPVRWPRHRVCSRRPSWSGRSENCSLRRPHPPSPRALLDTQNSSRSASGSLWA